MGRKLHKDPVFWAGVAIVLWALAQIMQLWASCLEGGA